MDATIGYGTKKASCQTPPKLIGKYKILEELSSSSRSSTFLAILDQQLFVLKVVYSEDDARFEASVHRVLQHPHVVTIVDEFMEPFDKGCYHVLVLKYAGRCNLVEYIISNKEHQRINVVLDLVEQVAKAAGYVNSRSIIHSDIKPSNIIVQDDGTVTLVDLGSCKIAGDDRPIECTNYYFPNDLKMENARVIDSVFSATVDDHAVLKCLEDCLREIKFKYRFSIVVANVFINRGRYPYLAAILLRRRYGSCVALASFMFLFVSFVLSLVSFSVKASTLAAEPIIEASSVTGFDSKVINSDVNTRFEKLDVLRSVKNAIQGKDYELVRELCEVNCTYEHEVENGCQVLYKYWLGAELALYLEYQQEPRKCPVEYVLKNSDCFDPNVLFDAIFLNLIISQKPVEDLELGVGTILKQMGANSPHPLWVKKRIRQAKNTILDGV